MRSIAWIRESDDSSRGTAPSFCPSAIFLVLSILVERYPSVELLKLQGKQLYFKEDPSSFNFLRDSDRILDFKALRKLYLHDTRRNGSCLAIGIVMVRLLPLLAAPYLGEVTLKLELRSSVQKGLDELSIEPEWAILDDTLSNPRFLPFRRLMIPFTISELLFFVTPRRKLSDRTEEAKTLYPPEAQTSKIKLQLYLISLHLRLRNPRTARVAFSRDVDPSSETLICLSRKKDGAPED
ncbi:hypothetical protein C8J56DRAFT_1112431 [Mycena floridula]|nr:hypothetical protein C8J56DRAFT_1112431 [Mycena floridula]